VIRSAVAATARGSVGALTSAGRVFRLDVLDLPALPPTASAPHLRGGAPLSEFVACDPGERVVALTSLLADAPGVALGTAAGVVKRVQPDVPASRPSWDVIRLDEGDQVVGAVDLTDDAHHLVFLSSDAQLLHFPAAGVRPQGRAGGGVAGIRLAASARAVFFGAVDPGADNVVVSVAGTSGALPGTEPGSVKVTTFDQYPAKGRGTGGVRCHRFRSGEDLLILGWVGPPPAKAAAASGVPVDLPEANDRRDGTGTPGSQPIAAIGSGAPPA
jgi:DNA gyrase subunit A